MIYRFIIVRHEFKFNLNFIKETIEISCLQKTITELLIIITHLSSKIENKLLKCIEGKANEQKE